MVTRNYILRFLKRFDYKFSMRVLFSIFGKFSFIHFFFKFRIDHKLNLFRKVEQFISENSNAQKSVHFYFSYNNSTLGK